jgi:predicted regulator of Ras-like GTPase activity (Roadblock/LC7/MglB family)
MSKLDELIQQVRVEVGSDFVSTDVVGTDGLSIAGGSLDPNFDNSEAAARYAMVMKLASRASDKLTLGAVDDNLTTTDKYLILTRFLGDGSYFWELVVDKGATLGSVRLMMNELAPKIWSAIPR